MEFLELKDRGAGCLRYVERKLGLDGDDWSRNGSPAAAWDNISGVPTTNWYRFDSIGLATTIVLAARGGAIGSESAVVALDGMLNGSAATTGSTSGWNKRVRTRLVRTIRGIGTVF